MKKFLALFLLTAATLAAQSATFNLGPYGRLTLFLPGDWKVDTSNFSNNGGTILFAPARPGVNASCTLAVSFPETDRYNTKVKLKLRVEADGYGPASESVEKKAIAKEFAVSTGFGYYCNFTDPELVGKPPEPGNFKTMSAGKIRLNEAVLLDVSIVADGFSSEPYQQLLGAIEGLEFVPGTVR